jgi:hypothetical protein
MDSGAILARPVGRVFLTDRLTWLLSLAIGCGGALALFPMPVLLGTAAYWDHPRGIVPGSWADMIIALSGYEAFLRDGWRLPLFEVKSLGAPAGTNVVFTDSIPLLLLVGRLLFRLTGAVVPLFGPWSGLCIVAMALASTGLVRALGARDLVPGVAAAIIGISMPVLLARWGHLALMGQAIMPLALTQYVRLRAEPRPDPVRLLARTVGLCLLALLIHPYLFLMVGGVALATIAQAALDRRLTLWALAGCLVGFVGIVAAAVASMGHLTGGGPVAAGGFGYYSMNLLSPIVPQGSGLMAPSHRGVLDATGGQYEGLAYLGAGLLLLSVLALVPLRQHQFGLVKRHACLLGVLAAFVLLALSHEVYVGPLHLVSLPLPDFLLGLAGIVRASGRFVWPALYLLAAVAIVRVARRPHGAAILACAALLQWIDAGPRRAMIAASVAAPAPAPLDGLAWAAALAGVDRAVVDPPFACLPEGDDGVGWAAEAATQIQLMAARTGVATNTLNAARLRRLCDPGTPNGRTLLIRFQLGAGGAQSASHCRYDDQIAVCSEVLAPEILQTLLAARR